MTRALAVRVPVGPGPWAWTAARHWLMLFNLAAALILVGAVAAPLLDALQLGRLASAVREAYLLLCPQRPAHSYFLFGFALALEQRPLAMFVAQLAGGLVYAIVRGRVTPLGWLLFIALSLPMAWDILSQSLGLRDSDWLTRTWTGALFTLALLAWLYPRLDRALRGSAVRAAVRPSASGHAAVA